MNHLYNHPRLVPKYNPGDIVEHYTKPGVPLVIVSGPEQGLTGNTYRVQVPGGKVEIVLERNIRR